LVAIRLRARHESTLAYKKYASSLRGRCDDDRVSWLDSLPT
jgi:hypothetical protein